MRRSSIRNPRYMRGFLLSAYPFVYYRLLQVFKYKLVKEPDCLLILVTQKINTGIRLNFRFNNC